MNITIKHAGRKAEIMQRPSGNFVCNLFCINGSFLRMVSFPDRDQAIDFSIIWLHITENEFDSILKQSY